MPVSKNRRKKPKLPATATVARLPDRRAMESVLAHLAGGSSQESIAAAQAIVYQAWDAGSPKARATLARQALAISPLCPDAYNILAEQAKTPREARDLYAKAVEAGTLALGPEGFEEYAGHFWGFMETRPYMRARAGLADALQRLGDQEAAIGHYRAMLELNPNDNQGIRDVLAALLLEREDIPGLKQLLTAYDGDTSAIWTYTRALLAFRDGGAADESAVEAARQAWASNEHVPALLAGTKRPVPIRGEYITMGGPDQATHYVRAFGAAWRRTDGAIAWLAGLTATWPPRQRGNAPTTRL